MVTNNKTSRLSPPPSRGVAGWLFAIAYLICSVLAFFEIRYAAVKTGLADDIATVVETRRLIDRDVPLRSSYTGVASLDEGISTLVAAFIAGPTGWDKGFQLHMFYFLVSFFPVMAVWAVESVRKANRGALISLYVLGKLPLGTNSVSILTLSLSTVRACSQSSTRPSVEQSLSLFITWHIFSILGNPSIGHRSSDRCQLAMPKHYSRP